MIIVVTGGRDFTDVPFLWRYLDTLENVRLVVDGASDDVTGPYVGWDYWSHQWALARGIPTARSHADWRRFGGAAGPIRNGEMLKTFRPDKVIAGPGGRGTRDCKKQARDLGIPVVEVSS